MSKPSRILYPVPAPVAAAPEAEPTALAAGQSGGRSAPAQGGNALYLEHFKLREAPFRMASHTGFFFTGASRRATLEALAYAVVNDDGIVKVSGEVGSGKSMLCRMLLGRLPAHAHPVYLPNPALSREEILLAVAGELGLTLQQSHIHQSLRLLEEHLARLHAAGRQVVVLIDEAHMMPGEALGEICRLSNLETHAGTLLQIVLFGQPELDKRLLNPDMRQLRERITHNFALSPLSRSETADYLAFRLRAAGYQGPELFSAGAVRLIAEASEGLARRVNVLADKALLAAFSSGLAYVDTKQARIAIRGANFPPMHNPTLGRRSALAGVAVMFAGLLIWGNSADWPPVTPPSLPSPGSSAPAEQAPATEIGISPPAITPAAEKPSEPPASEPVPEPSAPQPPTLAELTATTETWLQNAPGNRFFLQLLSTPANDPKKVEDFIEKYAPQFSTGEFRVYRSRLSGQDRLGVIHGEYPTEAAAKAAVAALPNELRARNPYPRQIEKLR